MYVSGWWRGGGGSGGECSVVYVVGARVEKQPTGVVRFALNSWAWTYSNHLSAQTGLCPRT